MGGIFIIEDNDDNYYLLSETLSEYDLTLTRAASGAEFFSIISKRTNFDLVLMDLMLPDTDGIELTKHLISNEIFLPIVFISAYTERCEEIYALGVEYFLSKPIMIELFLSVISKYIPLEVRRR
jgi:CheY-like chemotaxis protein